MIVLENTVGVKSTDLIYKVLVKCDLISSNQEAKRLITSKAISINYKANMNATFCYVTLTDTVEDLAFCARLGFWLRIGKKFLEKLEFVKREE